MTNKTPPSLKEACQKAAEKALEVNASVQWATGYANALLGSRKANKGDVQYQCFKMFGRYLEEERKDGTRVQVR